MFNFFKKPAIAPENVPLPESPPRIAQEQGQTNVASSSNTQTQLRTPSPSIASGSIANGPHASPAPTASNASSSASHRALSPSHGSDIVIADALQLPPEVTFESLSSLILSVPAKIFHTYTLSRIPDASEDTLRTLSSFFDSLTPPPVLHCVRCHKDYVEVDNDDRSCLVPHDDESAEVERVGRGSGPTGRKTTGGTEYETTWGCCGKTTEGNGDQGPPDGFCYEGRHTTDIKRARFREDSTPQDDKLVSCLRLNCHGIRDKLPRSSARKRPRPTANYRDAGSDDDGSEGEADSGIDEIVKRTPAQAKMKSKAQPKGKGKEKEKEKDTGEDKMDVDEGEGESASRAGSVKGKGKAKAKAPITPATPASAGPKGRNRPIKPKPHPKDSDGESVAASVKSAPATMKRRGRTYKSKEYISDSEEERGRTMGPRGPASRHVSISVSPTRIPNTPDNPPLRTRSQSRSRVAVIISRIEAANPSGTTKTPSKSALKPTPSRSKLSQTTQAEDDEEKQPKKKRKFVL